MILQALKGYYDRMAENEESDIAPEGFEKKELQFLIVIDEQGKFIQIEDTREKVGKKLIGKTFLLPRSIGRSGVRSYETTFLLWDHIGYLLGEPADDLKSVKQHQTWLKALKDLPKDLLDDAGVKAVLQFYENDGVKKAVATPEIEECLKSTQCNMAFRLAADVPVPCRKAVQEYVKSNLQDALSDKAKNENEINRYRTCSITGEKGEIVKTHNKTPINKDANCLVGFQKNRGYDSYGKEQGENAPVIKSTEFAYVTALNTLLKSKEQKIIIGDAATVFWSEKRTDFESDFSFFFNEPEKDNPSFNTEKVKSLFQSIDTGAYTLDEGRTPFYVLGLSPGGGTRISVRFWQVGTINEFSRRIRQHFEDFSIVKPPKEPQFYSVWRILVNIATQDKSENIPPTIAGDFMRSILNGTPYPATLLQAALRRIRSDPENRVKPVRAALIRAYLNRYNRFNPNENNKEVTMELDPSQPSIGYQIGRLFAALEKIQEEANPGINATIRERFYGAACAAPVTVFGNLLRLKNHHLAKIENKGRVVNFERLLSEIICKFDDFPAHLNLHEQGRFAIGYYHQRQAFFVPQN